MNILINVVLVIFIVVALLMVLVVLMQRPKSEGLGAAFGGGMTENLFGAQTTNVLTKITGWLAGMFFILTFLLSVLYAKRGSVSSDLRQELMRTQAGATAPAIPPAPGAPGDANAPGVPAPVAPAGDAAAAIAPAPAETSPENLPQIEGGNPPTPADQAVGAVRQIPPPGNPIGSPAASPAPSP